MSITERQEIQQSSDEMELFRRHLIAELGKTGYKDYLDSFKTELQKIERPAGVSYMEVLTVLFDRIEQNNELSDEAKEQGKALYFLAAAELMKIKNITEWMLS